MEKPSYYFKKKDTVLITAPMINFEKISSYVPAEKTNKFIQCMACVTEDDADPTYSPFWISFDFALVDSAEGNPDAESILRVEADAYHISKAWKGEVVGIMDSHSQKWGEIACQLFHGRREKYEGGSVLFLDVECSNDPYVSDKIFAENFEMQWISCLMLTAAAKMLPNKYKAIFDYFVYFGNVSYDPGDARWRDKMRKSYYEYLPITRSYVQHVIPNSFYCVWVNSPKLSKETESLMTIKRIQHDWKYLKLN